MIILLQNPTLLKTVSIKNKQEIVKLYSIKYQPSALDSRFRWKSFSLLSR